MVIFTESQQGSFPLFVLSAYSYQSIDLEIFYSKQLDIYIVVDGQIDGHFSESLCVVMLFLK